MSYLSLAILVTALTTYALRALPLLVLRREIRSRWLNSFLYYVPWAVLTAMIIPGIFTAMASVISGVLAGLVALVLAWRGHSLAVTALGAAGVAWLAEIALPALG